MRLVPRGRVRPLRTEKTKAHDAAAPRLRGGRLVAIVLASCLVALSAVEASLAEDPPFIPPTPASGGGTRGGDPGDDDDDGGGGVARQPVQATQLRLVSVGAYWATVSFKTSHPIIGRVAYGPAQPLLFAAADGRTSLTHTVRLDGLLPGRRYELQVLSHEGAGVPGLAFQTKQRPEESSAEVAGGALLLGASPFLPLMAFAPCAWNIPQLLAAGVNVLIHDNCDTSPDGRVPESVAANGRRAWNVLAWDKRHLARGADGVIGYSWIDEPDGRAMQPSDLPRISVRDRVSVLTLTHHVVTGGLTWATGSYYPDFIERADVVGFDYYPMQEICRTNDFAAVYDLQRNLVALAGAKATFQWIEVGPMRCSYISEDHARKFKITHATVRAEMVLAVAGGASGLGVFPVHWNDPAVTSAVRSTFDQLAQLAPFLRGERLGVQVSGENVTGVRAGVRRRADAVLVMVVNGDAEKTAKARLWGAELIGRQLVPIDGGAAPTISTANGAIELQLAPLEARIFVSPARPFPIGG